MKNALKFIIPLFCIAVSFSSGNAEERECSIGKSAAIAISAASISAEDSACIPIRPTSSINNGARVQKNSRQSNTNQRRYGTILKDCKVTHLYLSNNTYINQYISPTAFPLTAHRLICLGRLLI